MAPPAALAARLARMHDRSPWLGLVPAAWGGYVVAISQNLTEAVVGAFLVAALLNVPVLPAALAGTRDVLRDGHWLPRRGSVTLTLGKLIAPAGEDWPAALELRAAAREHILRHCGEGDLQA